MDQLQIWLAALRKWHAGLARREQHAVIAGAVACSALLLLAAWLPVERRVTGLEKRVQDKQADLAWLQSVAPQLNALRNSSVAAGRRITGGNRRSRGARDRHRALAERQPAGR